MQANAAAAIESGSFFPTAQEVVQAVQFARENPAVVLGVVVGITSLTVAKYYEEHEEEPHDVDNEQEDDDEESQDEDDHDGHHDNNEGGVGSVHEPKKMNASEETMSLTEDLSRAEISSLAAEASTMTMRSSPTMTVFGQDNQLLHEDHHHNEGEHSTSTSDPAVPRSCSFCNQGKGAPTPDGCCDPDWGWFIPTTPDNAHHAHHHPAF